MWHWWDYTWNIVYIFSHVNWWNMDPDRKHCSQGLQGCAAQSRQPLLRRVCTTCLPSKTSWKTALFIYDQGWVLSIRLRGRAFKVKAPCQLKTRIEFDHDQKLEEGSYASEDQSFTVALEVDGVGRNAIPIVLKAGLGLFTKCAFEFADWICDLDSSCILIL